MASRFEPYYSGWGGSQGEGGGKDKGKGKDKKGKDSDSDTEKGFKDLYKGKSYFKGKYAADDSGKGLGKDADSDADSGKGKGWGKYYDDADSDADSGKGSSSSDAMRCPHCHEILSFGSYSDSSNPSDGGFYKGNSKGFFSDGKGKDGKGKCKNEFPSASTAVAPRCTRPFE